MKDFSSQRLVLNWINFVHFNFPILELKNSFFPKWERLTFFFDSCRFGSNLQPISRN